MRRNPYPGLRPFDTQDNRFFFGRERQVRELLDRLDQDHFLAVVGVSGSGKSSLVKAGLLPSLRKGFITNACYRWRTIVLRPGTHPMKSLWRSLARGVVSQSPDGNGVKELAETFGLDSRSLIKIGRDFLGKGQRLEFEENLLIVVDQFEEVFTLVPSRTRTIGTEEDEFEPARAFVDRLMKASQQSEVPIYVVITMRSDYLGDCARFRDFPELLNRTQYLISRMTVGELVDAIVRPAKLGSPAGDVERPLLNRLLNDFNDEPRNLPRLQHVLAQTWEQWSSRNADGVQAQGSVALQAGPSAELSAELSLDDYRRAGEFDRALDEHAERLFGSLGTSRRQDITELIFKRITAQDVSNRLIRCPTTIADINSLVGCKKEADKSDIRAIIRHFLDDRVAFLTSPDLEDGLGDSDRAEVREPPELPDTATIDITHESLIYGWQRLAKWVREESASAGQYQRLAQNARDHEASIRGWLQAGEVEYFQELLSSPTKGWTEAWSVRYKLDGDKVNGNPDWKNVNTYINDSKWHVRWSRLWKLALVTMLGAFPIALAVALLFAKTKSADDYASQSEYERAQLGSKTQERAALLDIASFKIQARPSNTDLAAWETFDRITPGIPLPTQAKQPIDRLFVVPDKGDKSKNTFRIVALSTPKDLAEGLQPVTFRSPDYVEDQHFLGEERVTAVSPSGRYAATPCKRNRATIRELGGPSTSEVGTVPCVSNVALIVEPSRPDGTTSARWLATVEYQTPQPSTPRRIIGAIRVTEMPGHDAPLFERDQISLLNEALSKDGRYLAYVEKEDVTRSNQRPTAVLRLVDLWRKTKPREVHGVSTDAPLDFSADGSLLAVGMVDGKITIIDLKMQSQTTLHINRHSGELKTSYPIAAIAFSNDPNTMLLAYSEDGHDNVLRVVSYQASAGKVEGTLKWSDYFGRKVSHLTFSPTDYFLGLAVGESTARVKLAATGFETSRVTVSDRATWIAFSPNPHVAFASAANGEVVRFATENAEPPDVDLFACPNPQQVAVGNKGNLIAVSCLSVSDRASKGNAIPDHPTRNAEIQGDPSKGKMGYVAPSSKIIEFDDASKRFREVNGANLLVTGTTKPFKLTGDPWSVDRQGEPCHAAAAKDVAIVAVECDGVVWVVDVAKERASVLDGVFHKRDASSEQCQEAALSLGLTPNGSILSIGDDCGGLSTYKIDFEIGLARTAKVLVDKSGKPSAGPSGESIKNPITALAFSSDSQLLAAGTADGVVKVMKIEDSRMQDLEWSPTKAFDGSIGAIQFNPKDASTLIVGSGRAAHVVSTSNGRDLVHISDSDDSISAVTFSTTGTWAAASTLKGRTHLLDLSSAKIADRIEALAASVFGRALSTASADKTFSGKQRIVGVQLTDSLSPSKQEAAQTLLIWAEWEQMLAMDDMGESSSERVLALTRHNVDINDRLVDICSCLKTDLEVSGVTHPEVCGKVPTKRSDGGTGKCFVEAIRDGTGKADAPTQPIQF